MAVRDPFRRQPPDEKNSDVRLARGLGWFSLIRGVAQVAAPAMLARAIGLVPHARTRAVIRLMGAREIATGLAVLARPRSSRPLWARVVGDAIDLALLRVAARSRSSTGRLVGATRAVAGITALDVWAARRAGPALPTEPVRYGVTINKPIEEVYAFHRQLERLPQFVDYLESVTEKGNLLHMVIKLPTGGTVSWDGRITEDRPGEVLAWQSIEGSPLQIRVRVTFARTPGRNMTEVRVEKQLGISQGPAIGALLKLFTKDQLKKDMRRFKQLIETGEVLFATANWQEPPHPAHLAHPAKPGEHVKPIVRHPTPHAAEKGAAR
jgi:uncharacterized membrane protein